MRGEGEGETNRSLPSLLIMRAPRRRRRRS